MITLLLLNHDCITTAVYYCRPPAGEGSVRRSSPTVAVDADGDLQLILPTSTTLMHLSVDYYFPSYPTIYDMNYGEHLFLAYIRCGTL